MSINALIIHAKPTLGEIIHSRILDIELELTCKRGSYGGISLRRDKCYFHLKRLREMASVER